MLDAVEVSCRRSPTRSLGVGNRGSPKSSSRQLSFEGEPADAGADGPDQVPLGPAWREVESSVDAIRARYGQSAVGSAALVGRHGLALKRRGDAQWGPGEDTPEGA